MLRAGDLLPSTNGSKIFTSFFAVLGVSIIGGALAHLVMTFFENENLAVTKFLKLTSKFRKQFIQHRESSIADRVWPIVAIIVLYYSQVIAANSCNELFLSTRSLACEDWLAT